MDYRVAVGWRNHPKRIRLLRRLGPLAVLAVHDLWEFCAASRTEGDLTGMTAEALAVAAGYDGDAGAWVATLLELGLLDGEPGALRVHDWEEHNPWVAGQAGRSEAARVAASARWNARRIDPHCAPHGAAMRKGRKRNAPSVPDPSVPDPSVPDPSVPLLPREHASGVAPGLPGLANSLVALFPDLALDVEGLLSEWQSTYPGLDLVQLAREAKAQSRANGRKVDRAASLLGRWYQRAWHERRAEAEKPDAEAAARAKRKAEEEARFHAMYPPFDAPRPIVGRGEGPDPRLLTVPALLVGDDEDL